MAAATATTPAVDPASPDLLAWARGVARGIRSVIRRRLRGADAGDTRRCSRFDRGSDEEQELEQVALLEMVRAAHRFDPAKVPPGGNVIGAFKGFAHASVRFKVMRAARGLSNGGIDLRDGGVGRKLAAVEHLSARESAAGRAEFELTDPRTLPADPPAPPPDPGRLDRVTPADLPEPAAVSNAAADPPPQKLAAVDTRIQVLRAELGAAEQLREYLEQLLTLILRYPALGPIARQEILGREKKG